MSVNNRKYLTSTGMLLKQLNEESNNTQNNGSYHHSNSQMYTHPSANNYHPQSNSSSLHNLGPSMNQYHQPSYSNMPSYGSSHNMPNQFSAGLFPNVPNNMPVTVAAAAALLSKLAQPNQFTSSVPEIMMLPGSMSQQRWQQKSNKNSSSHPYQQQQQQKQQKHVNKKSNISLTSSSSSSSITAASSSSSASSVTELPETFGLPSNKISKTTHSKYTNSTTSLQSTTPSSNNPTDSSKSQTDILIEDKSNEVVLIETNDKSDDIEIIGENYPSSDGYSMETSTPAVTASSNSTVQNTMMIQTVFQSNNDENFRNYLAKNYKGGQLAIATKPQCNFISNFACINQILTECDFYNKLRRRKPYSNVKLNKIYDLSEDDESEEEDDNNNNENDAQHKQSSRIKSKKIIVIDDTNEDMHKPWITPELIKLIKHRNLLQSKINENNGKLDPSADAELMKKFKNLRNKVTKLVKKARKDYLTKYIQESKENKIASTALNTNEKQANQNDLDSELINNLAKNPAPPPPPTTVSTSTTNQPATSQAKSPSGSLTAPTTTEKTANTTVSTSVSGIISQLSSTTNQTTFLQNSNNLMMSLYNSYFNQYLQQYQHQQQQAQQLANAASAKTANSSKDEANKKPEETDTGYELLQKQAAYYAQQQRAIQGQLETSLSQSAQQLVQEIATMATKTTNQAPGFIINQQFNHQQHYVIPPQQPIQMGPFGGLY